MNELTPDEVKAIVAEIVGWNSRIPQELRERWQIHAIVQLDLPMEAYEVVYHLGTAELFFRNEDGKLEPAAEKVYYAPEYKLVKGEHLL